MMKQHGPADLPEHGFSVSGSYDHEYLLVITVAFSAQVSALSS